MAVFDAYFGLEEHHLVRIGREYDPTWLELPKVTRKKKKK